MASHNKDKFLEGLKSGKYTIKNLPRKFRGDSEFLLQCAEHDSTHSILKKASRSLQSNRKFVVDLLKIDGEQLSGAKPVFKDDPKLVQLACRETPTAYNHASSRLREDKGFNFNLLHENGEIIRLMPREFSSCKGFAMVAVQSEPLVYRYINDSLKLDPTIARMAISHCSFNYFFLPQEFKDNKDFVLRALSADEEYTYCLYKDKIPDKLKEDEDVALCACKKDINCVELLPSLVFSSNQFKKDLIQHIDEKVEEMTSSPDEEVVEQGKEYEETAKLLVVEREALLLQEVGGRENIETFRQKLLQDRQEQAQETDTEVQFTGLANMKQDTEQ